VVTAFPAQALSPKIAPDGTRFCGSAHKYEGVCAVRSEPLEPIWWRSFGLKIGRPPQRDLDPHGA
jgi:hypothetical protein